MIIVTFSCNFTLKLVYSIKKCSPESKVFKDYESDLKDITMVNQCV